MFRRLVSNTVNTIDNKKKFNKVMNFVEKVFKETESYDLNENHPLVDIVNLVGRNLQTEYLTSLLLHDSETDLHNLQPDIYFINDTIPINENGECFHDLVKELQIEKEIKLGTDLILPWPWKKRRLINTISHIGDNRSWGEWRQDHNHRVELWLPMGIAWVNCGNHSIASGVIQGKGKLNPDVIYDISNLYNFIFTDGEFYYSLENDKIISKVQNVDIAIIFEIGRFMDNLQVSF